MKKIIFVINNLETGGVQKSLLNLLNEIHNDYDITLLTFFGNDTTEKLLPSNVKIIKPKGPFRQLGLSSKHTKSKPLLYLERAFWVTLTKMLGRSFAIKLMCLFRKKYKGYDVAISFIHESPQKNLYSGCNEYVLKMVNAKKKIGWLHCDFERSGANNAVSKKIYVKFNTIVACSDGCKKSFLRALPHLESRTKTVINCHNFKEIISLSNDNPIEYEKQYINAVIVARLSPEKGIERALYALNYAIERNLKVKLHIVGGGNQKDSLIKICKELNISDNVSFYGEQTNPYRYIKNADLLFITSYHEAAPLVIDEALALGVPILSTSTTSSDDMISQRNCGWVCENSQEDINSKFHYIVSHQNEILKKKEMISANISCNNIIAVSALKQIID